jgi:hypothetical protein
MPQTGVWNVGIAGCGIGRTHIAQGYARHPDKFRVVALCDVDAGRLAAVADEFGIAHRTAAFDELLRIDDVDIVDICTPPHLHVAQVLVVRAEQMIPIFSLSSVQRRPPWTPAFAGMTEKSGYQMSKSYH